MTIVVASRRTPSCRQVPRAPRPRPASLASTVLALAALVFGSGCAGIEPWERENLASYGMRPDRDALAQALQDHMWFSREAANGGGHVGGGGCGCN